MRAEERGLAYYIETSTEALLIAVRNEEGLNNVSEAPKAFRERKKIESLNEWRGKVLHGHILRQTEDVSHPGTGCRKEISRKKWSGW